MRARFNQEGLVPFKTKRLLLASIFGMVAAGGVPQVAHADGFTAEQATAGQTAYNTNCARCHGAQLEGTEAPGLVGPDVMQNWATAKGLYDFISVAMPPEAPGALGEETYLNIVAYIMSFNGAQPGDTPMTAGDALAAISLPAETSAGASAAAAPAAAEPAADGPVADPGTAVPQAFTWGKELPGGSAPAAATPTASTEPSVPQAFTWGKELPQVSAQ